MLPAVYRIYYFGVPLRLALHARVFAAKAQTVGYHGDEFRVGGLALDV